MKLRNNANGFSPVEIILVIGLVIALGAIGWLFMDRNKDHNSAKDQSTSQSAKTTESQTSATPAGTTTAQKYLEIKEWGVKIPLTDEYNDAVYCLEQRSSGESYVYLSARSIGGISKDADGRCSASVAALERLKSGDTPYTPNGEPADTQEWIKTATKIGDYYYRISGSQSAFSDDDSINTKATSLRAYFGAVGKNIQAL